jgi:hypothetical protein
LAFFRHAVPDGVARYDDPELLRRIGDSVRRARHYGIESWEAMTRFVGLSLLVNPAFDAEPAIHQFLSAPDLDPDMKVYMLTDQFEKQLRTPKV